MMAAAQAAAEAALREARERNQGHSQSHPETSSSEAAMVAMLQQQGVSQWGEPATPQHLSEDILQQERGNRDIEELLRVMAEREQQQQLLAAAAAAIASRPQEHYLTIAQNGMILGATETVTGIPADSLLMTSAYDAVHDEDLPGLLAVKAHFWNKGRPDVPAYIRRRTLEDDWAWLTATVTSTIDQPVPGIILLEKRVNDERRAAEISRLTRIAAILIQAVEAGQVTTASVSGDIEFLGAADLIELARPDARTVGQTITMPPQQSTGKTEPSAEGKRQKLRHHTMEPHRVGRESFDPLGVLKSIRSGVRLDMGMIRLNETEAKMVALMLTGRMRPDQLGPIIYASLNSPGPSLDSILDQYLPQHFASPTHEPFPVANISVINLSYTYLGSRGIELLSEVLFDDNSPLRTLDLSFCALDERGLLALARALTTRKRQGISTLEGLILSGNYISNRSAREIGLALSLSMNAIAEGRRRTSTPSKSGDAGYEEDTSSDDMDEDDHDEIFGPSSSPSRIPTSAKSRLVRQPNGPGLQLLHVAAASLSSDALYQLLISLGPDCPVRELNIHTNAIGPAGASLLVDFLEGKRMPKAVSVMPKLDRLDLSNNELGNEGTTKLTRAIAKRAKVQLVELRLSSNEIGSGGIETMMNKLMQHNLVSLSLDKNAIGDQGCQLVAASLPSMHQLSRLNLSFNQIGSRGVNTLMRSVLGCESITFLGLSGNIMKISGATAMSFMLSQHPRLEELELHNCCLSQAAQCHIVAGIIANRWVPMKRMAGFEAGPPMVAIGALDAFAHTWSNEECFRLRRDEQMKTILQWMESNRAAKAQGSSGPEDNPMGAQQQYLTPDFVSSINDVQGIPSQNAYLRMLGWLSKIPFDEDELTSLRKYFYDLDGGDGDRGSDGYINLKLRGDLLAALDSDVADEIRDIIPVFRGGTKGSVGMDLDILASAGDVTSPWATLRGLYGDRMPRSDPLEDRSAIPCPVEPYSSTEAPNLRSSLPARSVPDFDMEMASSKKRRRIYSSGLVHLYQEHRREEQSQHEATVSRAASRLSQSSASSLSRSGMTHSESNRSNTSLSERRNAAPKPRITMFPSFEYKLDELKETAKEMIDYEDDPAQQDIILTQYAEASLTILRQLRYHCMNSGFDGWRQGGLRRKVLVVDDSKVTRKLVSRAFEKANFIVDTAENGVEGVEKLKESIYDIAFMDIDMPVMNGFEATKKLREWEDHMRPGARQPICALTAAYVDDFEKEELMKFKEAGLDVMESKPCNIPRLFKVVDDVSPMFSDLSISVTHRDSTASLAS